MTHFIRKSCKKGTISLIRDGAESKLEKREAWLKLTFLNIEIVHLNVLTKCLWFLTCINEEYLQG